MKVVGCRLDEREALAVEEWAKKRGFTVSEVVHRAILAYTDQSPLGPDNQPREGSGDRHEEGPGSGKGAAAPRSKPGPPLQPPKDPPRDQSGRDSGKQEDTPSDAMASKRAGTPATPHQDGSTPSPVPITKPAGDGEREPGQIPGKRGPGGLTKKAIGIPPASAGSDPAVPAKPRLDVERLVSRSWSFLRETSRAVDPRAYLLAVVDRGLEEQGIEDPTEEERKLVLAEIVKRIPGFARILEESR